MHHEQLAFAHDERLPPQPPEQRLTVGRLEDRGERIRAVRTPMACSDDQQMQIVIAEHGRRRFAEGHHRAQHGKRIGTAIDEITHEPQSVAARIEADRIEQLPELDVTTLDVADDVMGHASETTRAERRGVRDAGLPTS